MGTSKMRASRFASLMVSSGSMRKSLETQRDRLEEVGADGLVAGLHVRQVHVGHPVGEEREQPVAELVPEEQRPPRLAAREARAEHRVGLLLHEDLHDPEQVLRVVLEVGVVDDRDLAVGLGEGGADRHALAAVRDVLEEDPLDLARPPVAAEPHALVERPILLPRDPALPGEPLQHPGGAVLGAVVHDDDLHALEVRRGLEDLEPREGRRDEVLLVVDGDEDREGRHEAPVLPDPGCPRNERANVRPAPRAMAGGCPGGTHGGSARAGRRR